MSKELYVGRLPLEYTEEDLRRLFAVAGTISYIHLVTDPRSGESKGCAYVKMNSEKAAKDAIECLDGAKIEHTTLQVSIARPQKPKVPGAGPRPGRPARPARPAADGAEQPAARGPGRPAGRKPGKPGGHGGGPKKKR